MGFFSDFFGGWGKKSEDPARASVTINGVTYAPSEVETQMQKIAFHICKDYIASSVSKCEIRTFVRGKEVFGEEYYRWNYAPNYSQSSTEFWQELIYRLYDNGEALILPIGRQLVIADSFIKEEYAVKPTVFSQVSRKGFTFSDLHFDSTNAIYLSLSGNVRPEALVSGISGILNKTLSEAVDKYKVEGGERGIFEYDAVQMGDDSYKEQINRILNEDFEAYFANKNAVLPIYSGTKYTPVTNTSGQKTSIVGDIRSLLEQSVSTAAQAMKIPPVLILGSVADSKTAVENFLTFCIDPLMNMITEKASHVLYGAGEVLKGSCLQADTGYIVHTDAFSIAASIDKIKAAAVLSTNEIRRRIGEVRINEKWADEYIITKNYENVENTGGNSNENDDEQRT